MNTQDIITCPYCGSKVEKVEQHNEKYYCVFCTMMLGGGEVQRNHERISVRIRDFALNVYIDKTTPELMLYSTFELLSLLKYARAERANIYTLMGTFYQARKMQNTDKYREDEEYSGKEYEKITRKMFVLENLIRLRLGYVPQRITNVFLEKYSAEMKKDKFTPMVIRQQRKDDIKK